MGSASAPLGANHARERHLGKNSEVKGGEPCEGKVGRACRQSCEVGVAFRLFRIHVEVSVWHHRMSCASARIVKDVGSTRWLPIHILSKFGIFQRSAPSFRNAETCPPILFLLAVRTLPAGGPQSVARRASVMPRAGIYFDALPPTLAVPKKCFGKGNISPLSLRAMCGKKWGSAVWLMDLSVVSKRFPKMGLCCLDDSCLARTACNSMASGLVSCSLQRE